MGTRADRRHHLPRRGRALRTLGHKLYKIAKAVAGEDRPAQLSCCPGAFTGNKIVKAFGRERLARQERSTRLTTASCVWP